MDCHSSSTLIPICTSRSYNGCKRNLVLPDLEWPSGGAEIDGMLRAALTTLTHHDNSDEFHDSNKFDGFEDFENSENIDRLDNCDCY